MSRPEPTDLDLSSALRTSAHGKGYESAYYDQDNGKLYYVNDNDEHYYVGDYGELTFASGRGELSVWANSKSNAELLSIAEQEKREREEAAACGGCCS